MYDLSGIGLKIREKRQFLSLTLEKLAEKADVSTNYIGGIERGEATPSLATLIKIANALGVNTDYLCEDYVGMPNISEHDAVTADILTKINNMSAKQKKYVLEIINTLYGFNKQI
jgi:transcriptional regulator with XRE-family HTH domain